MTGVTHVLRLSVFAIAALLGAQGLVYGQTKEFDQTVDLASGGRLILNGSKGDVEIIAWDEARVEIKARIEAPRDVSADYARRAVEATTVDVDVSSGSVSIRSNYDDVPERNGSWGYRSRSVPYVHYEIRAPRELDLRVEVDRGDTELEGFNGRIELDTDRGTLDATDLSGHIRIVVDRGAHARLSGIRGRIDIEVDRTNVTIRDLSIEGDSSVELDRGDLELEMAAEQALSLHAELSRRANLDSDFDITLQRQSRRLLEGTINGGGPELAIEADRSTIRLRQSM